MIIFEDYFYDNILLDFTHTGYSYSKSDYRRYNKELDILIRPR